MSQTKGGLQSRRTTPRDLSLSGEDMVGWLREQTLLDPLGFKYDSAIINFVTLNNTVELPSPPV